MLFENRISGILNELILMVAKWNLNNVPHFYLGEKLELGFLSGFVSSLGWSYILSNFVDYCMDLGVNGNFIGA